MKKPVYLDNAATSHPKPKAVAAAMAKTVEKTAGNPGRSFHKASLSATRIIHQAREETAQLFSLPHSDRLIFTSGATEGLNLAIKGLLRPGDKVAISRLEHNSVIRPLETVKNKGGVTVEYASCLADGTPDPDNIPNVKMLVTVAASNVTGSVANISALAKACKKKNVLLVVDAAQTAGSIPMPWAADVSALIIPGHKGMLGPQGVGLAWFAPTVEPEPLVEGGTGSASESVHSPEYWPDRHEAGTLNTPGIAGLLASVRYLSKRGISTIRSHETALCSIVLEGLGNSSIIELYPPADAKKRASLVCFNIKGHDSATILNMLDKKGIACRAGIHCSPQAHQFMGTLHQGAVRVSPGPFTTKKEIRFFIDELFQGIAKL